MSLITPLGEYIAPFQPVANITPFTYRDGLTYVDILEGLRCYVNETLVEFVNTNFGKLGDDFETQVNLLFAQVEAQLNAQDTAVLGQVDTLTQYVNDQVAAIIGSSITVTDPVLSDILNNTESLSRIFLDANYSETTANGQRPIGHDELKIFVNEHGVIGNNIADDTAAMQAIIDTAGTTPIVIPKGLNCKLTNQLNIASDNQTIIGPGTLSPVSTVHAICATGKKGLHIDGVKFTGGIVQVKIDAGSDDALIENCYSIGGSDTFVRIQNSNRARVINNTGIDLMGAGVVFWGGDANPLNPGYPGANVYGVVGAYIAGNSFTGSPATLTTSPAIGGGAIWGSCGSKVIVVGNYLSTGGDVGLDFEGSRDCLAFGNVVRDFLNGGLASFFASRDCSWIGNTYNGSALLTDATRTRAGIKINSSGGASGLLFKDNKIVMGADTTTSSLGMIVDGSTLPGGQAHTNIIVKGNVFQNCSINFVQASDCEITDNRVDNGAIILRGSPRILACRNTVIAGPISSPAAIQLIVTTGITSTKCAVQGNTIRESNSASYPYGFIRVDNAATAAVSHALINNLISRAVVLVQADATTNQTGNVIV